jgi:hypothetical protein
MREYVGPVVLTLAMTAGLAAAITAADQRTFATPEDAVHALVDAVKAGNLDDVIAIFGPEGQALVDTSDPATARRNREVFVAAVAERWRIEPADARHRTLIIGNEDWPFPVPLVNTGKSWRFDTAAGREEVLARRIGQNELGAIATCHAYVAAQHRYARDAHDGKAAGLYASSLRSDPGRQNGLFWAAVHGGPRSPLGDLVADAAAEGRDISTPASAPVPFHGYYFRILTAQGAHAAGGARSYVVNGELAGGFALVAWPAQYDATGVMTFIVNQDGRVRQKDLGPETGRRVATITAYDPDASWQDVH